MAKYKQRIPIDQKVVEMRLFDLGLSEEEIENFKITEKENIENKDTSVCDTIIDNSTDKTAQLRCYWRKIEDIKPLFEEVLSPVASCMWEALDRGHSREVARRIARPIGEYIAEIIEIGEAKPNNR